MPEVTATRAEVTNPTTTPDPATLWPEATEGLVLDRSRVRAWSNSALTTVQQCGERFRRRYLEREVVPPAPRMLRGTVVHQVARASLAQKQMTATLPSVEETDDRAATTFDHAWAAGVTLSAEEASEGAAAVAGRSKDFAIDLARFHLTDLAPAITPIALERRIIVRPKDCDLQINGTIDLIDRQPSGEGIRDLKTTERTPPGDAAEVSQQLTMYALLRAAESKALPAWMVLDFLVRTPKTARKKYVALYTTRTRADLGALVRRITVAAEAVNKGVFVPAPPDAWYCSRQWCEYHHDCVYVRRAETRPTA